MDIVLILLGILALLCGSVLFIVTDGNVRDFDFWFNSGSDTYKNMVGMRNAAICIMVVGGIMFMAGIIILAVRKAQEGNRRNAGIAAQRMPDIQRYCPFCGQPAGVGAFCQGCGSRLPEMTNDAQMSMQENTQKDIQENMQKGAQGSVQKKGGVSAAFILLLCMLPTVDVLNMLLDIFSLVYRYMMYPQLPMTDILSLLISAAKTVGVWCVGLLPVIVLTVMRKIDPMRIRVRDVIMWGIWCLSGLNIFHTFMQWLIVQDSGSYMLVGYFTAVDIKGKLSVSWLWPWLLLLLFLLVRSGTLRPTKIKFFVTAGLLAVWSLVLVILLPFLLFGVPETDAGVAHITDFLRTWLLGQWPDFTDAYVYAIQYLRVWACFVWLQCLVEIWFAAVYGEEKIRWSGLAFVLGLPLFTLAMTYVNLVLFGMPLLSYPQAMGAGAVIGCIALIVIYIVEKSRSQSHI